MLFSEYSLFASWNGTSDVQMMTIHHTALLFPLYARMSQFDDKEVAAELQILGSTALLRKCFWTETPRSES